MIILPDIQREQGPSESSPVDFEFQTSPIRPSPAEGGQEKCRGRRSCNLSLPALSNNSTTPLVESSVRRSSRINSGKDGFREVRLAGEPSKKRKTCAAVIIDETTRQAVPIPIEILQSWGIDLLTSFFVRDNDQSGLIGEEKATVYFDSR